MQLIQVIAQLDAADDIAVELYAVVIEHYAVIDKRGIAEFCRDIELPEAEKTVRFAMRLAKRLH
ncbi:hypothetical protein [Chromobacterium haemolyticum]|uniref:Uncharacterized protein n=1 Tax=Chromobacterium haemolyticum TaxID=394935 RepID=A0A1W0D1X4_9NEIS|nr:hypothetical protein [Chromobacterium haemolyticum]OQS41017.1 hypothetical protein B0T45_09285 [Chromobacterium haemolyticum]